MKFLTQKEMTAEELSLYSEIQDLIWKKFLGFMGDDTTSAEATIMKIEMTVESYDGEFRMASLCHLFYLKPIIVNAAGDIICSADETTYNPEMIR